MNIFKHFDKYTIRARILPSLFTALPLVIGAITVGVHLPLMAGVVGSAIASCGGVMLMAQFARDAGKKGEQKLFALWDGKPTTRMLRHRSVDNPQILSRRHKKLKAIMKLSRLPSPNEEAKDPKAADQIYESCVGVLREMTRNVKQFGLVFEENCNYGFRRNLWGLKRIGLSGALMGLFVCLGVFLHDWYASPGHRSMLYVLPIFVNAALSLIWVVGITPSWVRYAAEAYAERLLETTERL
jgi:hypothetical protein